MIILVSEDGETFTRIEEEEVGQDVLNILAFCIGKKEGRKKPPLKPPKKEGRKKGGNNPLSPQSELFEEGAVEQAPKRKKRPAPPYAEIYDMAKRYFPDWNNRTTTEKRNRKIRRLWNANGKQIFVFEELFKMVVSSDFLNSRNGHTFKGTLSLSWVIERAEDILGGKYTNKAMEWAIGKVEMVEGVVVGEGRTKVDPTKCKQIGIDEVSGLPKYIRHDTTNK